VLPFFVEEKVSVKLKITSVDPIGLDCTQHNQVNTNLSAIEIASRRLLSLYIGSVIFGEPSGIANTEREALCRP